MTPLAWFCLGLGALFGLLARECIEWRRAILPDALVEWTRKGRRRL